MNAIAEAVWLSVIFDCDMLSQLCCTWCAELCCAVLCCAVLCCAVLCTVHRVILHMELTTCRDQLGSMTSLPSRLPLQRSLQEIEKLAKEQAGCVFSLSSAQDVSNVLFNVLKLPVPPNAKALRGGKLISGKLYSTGAEVRTSGRTPLPCWSRNNCHAIFHLPMADTVALLLRLSRPYSCAVIFTVY